MSTKPKPKKKPRDPDAGDLYATFKAITRIDMALDLIGTPLSHILEDPCTLYDTAGEAARRSLICWRGKLEKNLMRIEQHLNKTRGGHP